MSLEFKKINKDVEIWQGDVCIGNLYRHKTTNRTFLEIATDLSLSDDESDQLIEAIMKFSDEEKQ